jgi:WD40 repeat protein
LGVAGAETAAVRAGPRKAYDAFISYAHDGDEVFAQVLQRGLQHLAKPWNRRRAMEVFRDKTSLALSPGLWPSIQNALDASRWFVLLASPEAAWSHWVGEEITHWVSGKGTDRLLVVVTDGTWAWDDGSGDLSPASTACPPALRGVFPAEPTYLDMTWARRDAGLTLHNARFRDQIATLAAAIRDVPKEEIEGEDVRQQRRTRRIVRIVIAALTALVLATSVLAVVANIQWRTAIYQRQQAIYQRDVAISSELITQSKSAGDNSAVLSKLLSVAAWRFNPSSQARYAMLSAAARPEIADLSNAGAVPSVAFSPDGKILAAGSDAGVQLWNVATHQQIGTPLPSPRSSVWSVAFSPDRKILAVGGLGNKFGTVQLWNVATHQQIGSPLTFPGGSVDSVAFSPDGKALAVGGGDKNFDDTVWLWDVATRHQIGNSLPGAFGEGAVEAFSPDGKTLAAGGGLIGGTVQLWNVATHQQIGKPLAFPNAGHVSALAFNRDGKTLAIAGNNDSMVRLWNLATRQQIGSPLPEPAGPYLGPLAAFSPDGTTLAVGASGPNSGTVQLWDVRSDQKVGIPISFLGGPLDSMVFSPDGKTLATGNADGEVRLWDVAIIRQQVGSPLPVLGTTAAFSPDGKILAGVNDNDVQLWDVATQRQIPGPPPFPGLGTQIRSVAYSPDSKTLAISLDEGSGDGTICLWDIATDKQVGSSITIPGSLAVSVAFSPDGKILASGNQDDRVRLWDVATRQQIGRPLGGAAGDNVNSVAFSPDGKILASGSDDGTVRLWDVATREPIGNPLTAPIHAVESVAFSPDGKILASGNDDGDGNATVWLWDVATRQLSGSPLAGPTNTVESVAFSPDGTTLASANDDGTVWLWDMATRQRIGSPLTAPIEGSVPGMIGPVWSVAFSPDGKFLVTGNEDATVRLWDLTYLTDLVPRLCVSAARSLTPAEWARYVTGAAYQLTCP